MPAHAIGHGENRRSRDIAVLVHLTPEPDIGHAVPRELDLEARGLTASDTSPHGILTTYGHDSLPEYTCLA